MPASTNGTVEEMLLRINRIIERIETHILPRQIENADRFLRLLMNERKFFEKIVAASTSSTVNNDILVNAANAGNLVYYESILELIETLPGVVAIYKEVKYSSPALAVFNRFRPNRNRGSARSKKASVRVDIVAANGLSWVRVKASKSGIKDRSNSHESDDECSSDNDGSDNDDDDDYNVDFDINVQKSLSSLDSRSLPNSYRVIDALSHAAQQNLIHYVQPQVIFYFSQTANISDRTQNWLSKTGCAYCTSFDDIQSMISDYSLKNNHITFNNGSQSFGNFGFLSSCLNLDVSALLAVVSYTCHNLPPSSKEDLHPFALKATPIVTQIENERLDPILPHLLPLFLSAERLITTQGSFDKLWEITNTLGGPEEKQRARALFEGDGLFAIYPDEPSLRGKCVQIVVDEPSDRFLQLLEIIDKPLDSLPDNKSKHTRLVSTPKLTHPHINVFGTGDRYKATTVTSNQWVSKALQHMDSSGMYEANFSDISVWCHPSRSLSEKKQKGMPK